MLLFFLFFFSSRRRHTRCALVTGVQTCALPIYVYSVIDKPVWVVGGALVASPDRASQAPILGQVRDSAGPDGEAVPAKVPAAHAIVPPAPDPQPRAEQPREGKEWVSTCRSRWVQDNNNTNKQKK